MIGVGCGKSLLGWDVERVIYVVVRELYTLDMDNIDTLGDHIFGHVSLLL